MTEGLDADERLIYSDQEDMALACVFESGSQAGQAPTLRGGRIGDGRDSFEGFGAPRYDRPLRHLFEGGRDQSHEWPALDSDKSLVYAHPAALAPGQDRADETGSRGRFAGAGHFEPRLTRAGTAPACPTSPLLPPPTKWGGGALAEARAEGGYGSVAVASQRQAARAY